MYTKPIIEIEEIRFEDICANSGDNTMNAPIGGDGIGNAVVE